MINVQVFVQQQAEENTQTKLAITEFLSFFFLKKKSSKYKNEIINYS